MKVLIPILMLGGFLNAAENWPRFRGEDGAGVVPADGIPDKLGKDNRLWSAKLPGSGSSSPVIWGDHVFATGEDREAGTLTLACLSAKDGSERWSRTFKVGEYHLHQFNNTAASTPCVAEDRVVVPWYDAAADQLKLAALDFSGKPVWEAEMGKFVGQHGATINPVAEGDRVIAAFLHDGGGETAAYALADGKLLWSAPYPGGGKASYSTPLVRDGLKGKEVVITGTTVGVMALDFDNGTETWSLPGVLDERAICSPIELLPGVEGESRIQIGCKNNVFRVVRPPSEKGRVQVTWSLKKQSPYVPAPVAHDGAVYVLAEGGTITSADVRSGEVNWIKRLPANFYASPVMAGERLFCLSREGEMFVVPVTGGQAGEPIVSPLEPDSGVKFTDATPALAGGRIYVRLGARLDCYGE